MFMVLAWASEIGGAVSRMGPPYRSDVWAQARSNVQWWMSIRSGGHGTVSRLGARPWSRNQPGWAHHRQSRCSSSRGAAEAGAGASVGSRRLHSTLNPRYAAYMAIHAPYEAFVSMPEVGSIPSAKTPLPIRTLEVAPGMVSDCHGPAHPR